LVALDVVELIIVFQEKFRTDDNNIEMSDEDVEELITIYVT
tara:strand:- start:2414 stop:2536 length:123 start_codon:yes stop_codon:yes gene_type:complete